MTEYEPHPDPVHDADMYFSGSTPQVCVYFGCNNAECETESFRRWIDDGDPHDGYCPECGEEGEEIDADYPCEG